MTDPQQPASPPPHPYAATAGAPRTPRGTGALSIAAMAVGLAALVTVIISALYLGWGALLAALLGLVAIGLGIFGLLSRRKRVPAIVGLASGALSVIAAVAIGAIAGITLASALVTHATDGSGSSGSTPDASSDAPTAAVEWPENMATGGIVFDRDGVVRSDAPASGEPETTTSDSSSHSIRVYVDYRCPYCSQFETTNGDTLQQLAASGQATVEITPLAFLDRVSPDHYSSRASAAMACVADAQPAAAWDVNSHLFDPDVQPSETSPGLTNDALVDAIDEAAGGLNDDARSCIESEKFVPFAQALNTWVFDNPVPGAKDPSTTVTGTPFVLVDGVTYTGSLDDEKAFTDFLADQGMVLGSGS
ncbi:DsbA family protein [Leucobacter sp. NPDC058333]|uniref:DsbA family protein n=1 Tax=Leucobacter sp. NPDC058333 TaxID=3346450 RepID=UPI00364AB38B